MEHVNWALLDPIKTFKETIRLAGDCLVIDGGLSTELEKRGADLNDPLWTAVCLESQAHLIYLVHWDYLQAGADVLITSSYQATIQGFLERGMTVAVAESLLRKSVSIACHARDKFWDECKLLESTEIEGKGQRRRALVAASIGSYGAYLADGSEFRGYGQDVTFAFLKDFHRRRLVVLADSKPDLIAFETIPSKLEAEALIELLDEENVKIPAWISFCCKDGKRIASGELFEVCAALGNRSSKIVAVGVNCTPPCYIEDLLHVAKKVTAKSKIVYPNSGEAWNAERKEWMPFPVTCESGFGSNVVKWRDAGAQLIGGCCRTNPETIRSIANILHP